MARLKYVPHFVGTRNGICIYPMYGNFYMRTKSSLTAERVKNDKEFERSRKENNVMSRASKIGSQIYNAIPEKRRKYEQYRMLTGKAIKMLRDGMGENEIIKLLEEWYN